MNGFALQEHERMKREREQSIRVYKAKVNEVVQALLAAKQDVEDFVKNLPKF
jgi:hypothetical protein